MRSQKGRYFWLENAAQENWCNGWRDTTTGLGALAGHGGPVRRGLAMGLFEEDMVNMFCRGRTEGHWTQGGVSVPLCTGRVGCAVRQHRWRQWRGRGGGSNMWYCTWLGQVAWYVDDMLLRPAFAWGQPSRAKEKNLATMHSGIAYFTTNILVYGKSVTELVGYPQHKIQCRQQFVCRLQGLIFSELGVNAGVANMLLACCQRSQLRTIFGGFVFLISPGWQRLRILRPSCGPSRLSRICALAPG